MTDIVERLRVALIGTELRGPLRDDVWAAKIEIEKLQRLVGDMLQAQHKQERTNVLQEAELERLRRVD